MDGDVSSEKRTGNDRNNGEIQGSLRSGRDDVLVCCCGRDDVILSFR